MINIFFLLLLSQSPKDDQMVESKLNNKRFKKVNLCCTGRAPFVYKLCNIFTVARKHWFPHTVLLKKLF